jgi:hypothetical protein
MNNTATKLNPKQKGQRNMNLQNQLRFVLAILAAGAAALEANAQTVYDPYTFITVAGNTGYGSADGTNSAAQFAKPYGVAIDLHGNVYVADTLNYTIRKMTPAGTNWAVTTLAGLAGISGTADGVGEEARFGSLYSLAVDLSGNLYTADASGNTIRKISPVGTNWVVTTLAGAPGLSGSANGTNQEARFNSPSAVAVDAAGVVFVADTGNAAVRKLTPAGTNWVVTTLAGGSGNFGYLDGTNFTAQFRNVASLVVAHDGSLFVTESYGGTIRKLTQSGTNWLVATVAGKLEDWGSADGTNFDASFYYPNSIAIDKKGNLFVGDSANSTIRKLTPEGANWVVTTLAGSAGSAGSMDGTKTAASFHSPQGVCVDGEGNVLVADTFNNLIRKVTSEGVVTTLAGLATGGTGVADGVGTAARFSDLYGIAWDRTNSFYVASGRDATIRKITRSGTTWSVTTIAGLSGQPGSADGTNSEARFGYPVGLAMSYQGNLFVADDTLIRKLTLVGGDWVVTTIAGQSGVAGTNDGVGTSALFNYPYGLTADRAGNLYVADSFNHAIRKLSPSGTNWFVTTLAGMPGDEVNTYADGTNQAARFNLPFKIAVDSENNLFVADYYNANIRRLTPAGTNWVVTTITGAAGIGAASMSSTDGQGTNALFTGPCGVTLDAGGNLYVTDDYSNTIRKVAPLGTNWYVTTLAGQPNIAGAADGTGRAALFQGPSDIAIDATGSLVVLDKLNNTIRQGFPAGSVTAPRLNPPVWREGQEVLGMTGFPGLVVDLESSTDLFHWRRVGTCILENGTNSFVRPGTKQAAEFFRGQIR